MWQKLLGDATLYELLDGFDRDLAEATRAGGCRVCGGPLHAAPYPRKPRGPWQRQEARRWSFCCAVEGCRKRHTPASFRYLGRRVFWSAVVVLVSALAQGLSPVRVRALREQIGVSRRTLGRWRRWWSEQLPRTRFWREARGRFAEPVDPGALPRSLVDRFGPLDRGRVVSLLAFLHPLTTSSQMWAT